MLKDTEMKSKGGDIGIGSCTSELGLLTSSLKDVFARLWALEDRGYVAVCSKLVICTYLAIDWHQQMFVEWTNQAVEKTWSS